MITQDQLKNISERVEKLKSYLEIDKKLIEISNEEEKTANPDFWNNPKEAEVLMKSLRFKKKWVEDYKPRSQMNFILINLASSSPISPSNSSNTSSKPSSSDSRINSIISSCSSSSTKSFTM